MAFSTSRKGYQQIDPSINPGYPYERKYHNIGQLRTPYSGKPYGTGGDYGPVQSTRYYNPYNRSAETVLDRDFHPAEYLPGFGVGCTQFGGGYVPENYFQFRGQTSFGNEFFNDAPPLPTTGRSRLSSQPVLPPFPPVLGTGTACRVYDPIADSPNRAVEGYTSLRSFSNPLKGWRWPQ